MLIEKTPYVCIDQVDDSNDVVIYFAPVFTPPNVYVGRRVLDTFPAHRIFINCHGNEWFLNGIPGKGDVFSSARWLGEVVEMLRGNTGRVVTFGGSMGGYGAILFGCLINATTAIGQGTEFLLNITGGASESQLLGRQPDGFDIFEVINRSETKVFNYFGEGSITDAYCAVTAAERCRSGNFANYSVRGRLHTLPNYVNNRYGISSVIEAGLRGDLYRLSNEDEGVLLHFPEIIRAGFDLEFKSRTRPSELESAVSSYTYLMADDAFPDEVRSALYYAAARALYTAGSVVHALELAKAAVELAPDFLWNNALAIRASDACGRLAEARSFIESFLKTQDHLTFLNDLDATYCCAKYFAYIDRDNQTATNLCNEITARAPDHAVALELLRQVAPG